ncbi:MULTISPECIES: VOC family protein [unclassified Mesorhizobium]|uniref:VOC family protein n=1 Tax=unclassified Mesorhizobium TaxID=325217 RepID=UPI00333C4680
MFDCHGQGPRRQPPGIHKGLQLVVPDIDEAHRYLAAQGIEVSDIKDFPWGRFVFFEDPDDNTWSVQQLPPRS